MKLNENKTITPLTNYVFIKVIDNPYIDTMKDGIIVSSKSNFTNEGEGSGRSGTMEEVIIFGLIVEVGPNVSMLEIGDEVYFDGRAKRPVPFGLLNTMLVNEGNVIAVIRDNK